MKPTLGTQLRHLLELLDGAVSAAYDDAGLAYRPRYTPIMRVLMTHEQATIGFITDSAGITQPAATQTIALMLKEGLLTAEPGSKDGRQRVIRLSAAGRAMAPELSACWRATAAAAASLDADLPNPLSEVLDGAISALAAKSYGQRIAEARDSLLPARLSQPAEEKDQKK